VTREGSVNLRVRICDGLLAPSRQNSAANFAHLTETGLHFVGSLLPSDHPELLALPATACHLVDVERFGGLGAYDTGPPRWARTAG
jgi:hypothetical protein